MIDARCAFYGSSIDYRPTEFVTKGTVIVQGDLVGVAMTDIPPNSLGGLATDGVWDVCKAQETIPVGTPIYWDEIMEQATTVWRGNIYMGKSVLRSEASDGTVRILLNTPYIPKQ